MKAHPALFDGEGEGSQKIHIHIQNALLLFQFTIHMHIQNAQTNHRRSHRTGSTGPDPTNFWEPNMGPAQNFVAKY